MKRPTRAGRIWLPGTPGFDEAVLSSSFNGTDPGVRPKVYVEANNDRDVIDAVKRAAREGLRISVCSGGHSWLQNHLRDGNLLINCARLNSIQVDADARTAIAGPGCWSVDLDSALRKHGLFFPIAHAEDVCLGGFLLQGGFGWNSRNLGLACESVIGIDVVTAQGELIHANAQQHADLYWAARGSGPGFFGVVLRYHLRVHKRPRVTAIAMQVFRMRHLEEVFQWADAIGPEVPRSVEFQLLLTGNATGVFAPGIEVIAPVLTDSWREAREATAFLTRGPLKKKASLRLPTIPISTTLMSRMAARRIFPPRMRWSVDNMWTNAPMQQLLPGLRAIADTIPPMPSHVLFMSWHPPEQRPDMAFSVEGKHYLALYGEWRDAADDAKYQSWATDHMQAMAPMSIGIQLADENLARRPARFMSAENHARVERIRSQYDPQGLFHTWRGAAAAARETA